MPKKPRLDNEDSSNFTDSTDHNFLYPNEINADVNGLLNFFVSSRLFNNSFSDLYLKSRSVGWKKLIRDEFKRREPYRRFKSKRLLINRFVKELNEDASAFDSAVQRIKLTIDNAMSENNANQQALASHLMTSQIIFQQIEDWRKLQAERRLFPKQRSNICNLFTLQNRLTDNFLRLLDSPNPFHELIQLFDHSLIITEQPSGFECLAVTKYDKIGKEFLTKIKTRLVFLLDPERFLQHGKMSIVDVVLHPYESQLDPTGDQQRNLVWKTRTVTNTEQQTRSFRYVEFNETQTISLTKLNTKQRLLYNGQLCILKFSVDVELPEVGFHHRMTIQTRPFGLCCRANYYPKYLAKVYVQDLIYHNPQLATNFDLPVLEMNFSQFFLRFSGVPMRDDTKLFFNNKTIEAWAQHQESVTSSVPFICSELYEDLLAKFINQIRVLNLHPYLAMMYHDRLFLGISDDDADNQLTGSERRPELFFRFEHFDDCQSAETLDVYLVVHSNEIRRACLKSSDFSEDFCRCVCTAAKVSPNSLFIRTHNDVVPFENLSWYYDESLNQTEVVRTQEGVQLCLLEPLLRETINQVRKETIVTSFAASSDTTMTTSSADNENSFVIVGQLSASDTVILHAFQEIERTFINWIEHHQLRGSLKLDLSRTFRRTHSELSATTESLHSDQIDIYQEYFGTDS